MKKKHSEITRQNQGKSQVFARRVFFGCLKNSDWIVEFFGCNCLEASWVIKFGHFLSIDFQFWSKKAWFSQTMNTVMKTPDWHKNLRELFWATLPPLPWSARRLCLYWPPPAPPSAAPLSSRYRRSALAGPRDAFFAWWPVGPGRESQSVCPLSVSSSKG